MKTSQLDDVDRQLLHALIVAPRASFRVLAAALGVSDQTIARRYRRLVETADLRVTGLIHGPRAGWVDWMVRLQVAPGSAQRIADNLAQRPDTRWVRLYSGGTEIVCTLQARTPEQRNALFLRGLPGSRHVTGITAQSILHVFSPVAYVTYTGALSPDQLAALAEAAAEPQLDRHGDPGHPRRPGLDPSAETETLLRPEDDPLLPSSPATAGPRSPTWPPRPTGTSRPSGGGSRSSGSRPALLRHRHRRAVLGINANVMLWLKIEPASLDAAGRTIAAHPEIPFAAATTGATNLAVSAVFRDTRDLYAYLTTRLADLPGLQSVESAPIIGTFKRTARTEP